MPSAVRHPICDRRDPAHTTRRCLTALLVALLACLSPVAYAESPLAASVAALAHDLPSTPRHALIVASTLAADVPAPRGDELTLKVASLVAGALGGEAVAEPRVMGLDAARARSRVGSTKLGAIVYLDVKVASGELRVTADVYPVAPNGWDRVRLALASPTAHAYLHVPITAEVRAYLAPVHLDRVTLKKFTHAEGHLLALACGDLGGEGGNDVVLVSELGVSWGYLRDGRFVVVRHALASALSTRTPTSWREPLATATVVSVGDVSTLFVGWSDRKGVRASADLTQHTALSGLPVFSGTTVDVVRSDAARGAFEAPTTPASEPGGHLLVDAFAAMDLLAPDGHTTHFVAARDPSETLHLVRNGGVGADTLLVHDVGAQLALADLDQDGVPEVITTAARGEDVLSIASWHDGALTPRLKWSAPAGVDAVAVCPAEADDAPSLVAAVGSEIWLVH